MAQPRLSLAAQSEELKASFDAAAKYWREGVAKRRLRQGEMDLHLERQATILKTFALFQEHEPAIRAAIKAELEKAKNGAGA